VTEGLGNHSRNNNSNTVTDMERDILIVRDGDRYRLLHGHLHLVAELSLANAICVDVIDEGVARIVKGRGGLLVEQGGRRLPLFRGD